MHTLSRVCNNFLDPVTRSYYKATFVVRGNISLFAMNDTFGIHTETVVVGDLFFFHIIFSSCPSPPSQAIFTGKSPMSIMSCCFVIRCANVWRYSGNCLKVLCGVRLMNCTRSYVKFSPWTAACPFPCSLWAVCPLKILIESSFLFTRLSRSNL